MEYDYRNKPGPPYAAQAPMYRPPTTASPPPPSSSSSSSMYGQAHTSSLYPRVGQPSAHNASPSVNPLAGRHPSFHHAPPPSSSTSATSTSGIGIRVAIKQEYRITPPPQLSPIRDIPRSNFHFDFDFEKKILAEAEKETPNWSRLLGVDNLPSIQHPTPSLGTTTDPVVSKYISSGLNREAVPIAVANYGDNPTKVKEFVNGYTLLKEMGFSSKNVAEALLMNDNDTDKALAHFLNNPSQ